MYAMQKRGKDEEPLAYLKVTDIVEEEDGRGSSLYKHIEVRLFTEAAIVVEFSLDDTHCCYDGTS